MTICCAAAAAGASAGAKRWPVSNAAHAGCTNEASDFQAWYGLIETVGVGTLAITIAGVGHVISNSLAMAQERLRITQFTGNTGANVGPRAWPHAAAG